MRKNFPFLFPFPRLNVVIKTKKKKNELQLTINIYCGFELHSFSLSLCDAANFRHLDDFRFEFFFSSLPLLLFFRLQLRRL